MPADEFAPLKPAARWEPKDGDRIEVRRVHYDADSKKVETWFPGTVIRVAVSEPTFKTYMVDFGTGKGQPVKLADMRAAPVPPPKKGK